MAGRLKLRVVTPERSVFDGEVDRVVVPAHDGEVGILPRHAPLLASLGVGELRATTSGTVQRFFVEGGFVQVRDDRVSVLCDRASRLEDLDLRQAAREAEAARASGGARAEKQRDRAAALRRLAARAGSGR